LSRVGYAGALFVRLSVAMREMHRSALVPYSAEQMFDLIERVEDYPQFLPWCTGTIAQHE
jgi:ribosome-associated toxin RatA of RatAB toxin-antitoxin module